MDPIGRYTPSRVTFDFCQFEAAIPSRLILYIKIILTHQHHVYLVRIAN